MRARNKVYGNYLLKVFLVKCGKPTFPVEDSIQIEPIMEEYGTFSVVTLKCDDEKKTLGYQLVGPPHIMCFNGKWTVNGQITPKCIRKRY